MKQGIDISHHNGVVDFNKVKASGVSFVYIKATEGTSFSDPQNLTNGKGAKAAALDFGYYHFASPAKPISTDAVNEANFFSRVLKTLPAGNLSPVLDIERNGNYGLDGTDKKPALTPAEMVQWVQTFLDQMKANGFSKMTFYSYTPFINDNFPKNHPFGKLPLWLASYTPVPRIPNGWSGFSVWQYTDSATVPGVTGKVDANRSDFLPTIIGVSTIAIVLIAVGVFFLIQYK